MGHSQEEKAKTHQRIVKTASKLFREKGFDGIGLADLMKEAGVTVGAFYKHFDSKDALVKAAMADATQPPPNYLDLENQTDSDFVNLLKIYLSDGHKDNPGAGCSFAALASEMRRCDGETRELLSGRFTDNLGILTQWLGGTKEARKKAIFAYSAMSGAVSFARMVNDPKLSEEILTTVQEALTRYDKPALKKKR